MKKLEIKELESIKIENNLIYVNTNSSTKTIIPLNNISFVSEIYYESMLPPTPTSTVRKKKLLFYIGNEICIETINYLSEEESIYFELLKNVHKINDGLIEYHRSKLQLNLPKQFKL